MTQSQLPSPAHGVTAEVGEAKDRQGAVMRAHVSSIAWAFAPELKTLGLDAGERTEVLLSPAREQHSFKTGAELVRGWDLPSTVQDMAMAVSNELLGWLCDRGLIGMPRLTTVHIRQSLWIAAIDRGHQLPNFSTDQLSCSTGQRVLKYAERWGVITSSEHNNRAAWALMRADGRPVRPPRRTITQTSVSSGTPRGK